ncbi:MAG: hypothetical protein EOM66_04480 [Clostridia bacterium]|nr:hypothetical protein [Candidatus Pelethousia sp.]NCB30646.1 hypothetical protein [Clostridia bacterium]
MKYIYLVIAVVLSLLLAACAAPAAQPAATFVPEATSVPAVSPTAEQAISEADQVTPTPATEPDAVSAPTLDISDPYAVTFLGEDTSPADQAGGVGAAKAEALAAKMYGNELAGRLQSYACEGIAQYQGETYYAIYWSQLVEENGTANNSYMGHLYVSLDGETILEGDAESIYVSIGGG